MTPEPPKDSFLSKIIFAATILVLILILATCAFFIYNNVMPHAAATATPTPTPLPTVKPTIVSTPRITVTPTPVATTSIDVPHDTLVSDATGAYSDLGIWDHYIVYDELVSSGDIKVHLYNIDSRQGHIIAEGNVHSYGTIGNGKVALLYPDTNMIKLYDIASGTTSQGSVNSNAPRSSMVISGQYLLYCEDDGMTDPITKEWVSVYSVYLFNMQDATTSSIKSNIGKPIDIRMYGTNVVWTTKDGDGSDILLFNIQSNPLKVITITTSTALNNHARIYGNTIVYSSDKDGAHHIYMYDIPSGQTTLMTGDSKQLSADIYDNTIVFDDSRDGNWNIYTYDMTTKQTRYFTYEEHDQNSPVIYGKHVAYLDNRDGQYDVYLMNLS
jgi:beta propeller repeat protein